MTAFSSGGNSCVHKVGIVTAFSPNDPTTFFAWTPDAIPGLDGVGRYNGTDLKKGDWILMQIGSDNARRIFEGREKRRFRINSYTEYRPLFETKVNRGQIEIVIPCFPISDNTRSFISNGCFSLKHRDIGEIADDHNMTFQYQDGSHLDLLDRLLKPGLSFESSSWRVRGVKESDEEEVRRVREYENESLNQNAEGSVADSLANAFSSMNLAENEHIAFVETFSEFATYLWIVDTREQSIVRQKQGEAPGIGEFIIGTFRKQNDGRLECEEWKRCDGPDDCIVTDRNSHSVVKTVVEKVQGEQEVWSKYLGSVKDPRGHIPRNATLEDEFPVNIEKRKLEGSYKWCIVALLDRRRRRNVNERVNCHPRRNHNSSPPPVERRSEEVDYGRTIHALPPGPRNGRNYTSSPPPVERRREEVDYERSVPAPRPAPRNPNGVRSRFILDDEDEEYEENVDRQSRDSGSVRNNSNSRGTPEPSAADQLLRVVQSHGLMDDADLRRALVDVLGEDKAFTITNYFNQMQ